MKLDGEYTFDGPREEVWKILRDPDMLVLALPGTKSLKQVGENEYEGELQIRIGPIVGSFGGKLTVSNERPPENVTLTVEGTGKIGFVKGSGDVVLVDQGDTKTLVKYSGDLQIGGKVASVGQRLFDTVSKGMIKQGLDKLNEILIERSTDRK
jgi:carbon monoxide dehydrogenase subunit G